MSAKKIIKDNESEVLSDDIEINDPVNENGTEGESDLELGSNEVEEEDIEDDQADEEEEAQSEVDQDEDLEEEEADENDDEEQQGEVFDAEQASKKKGQALSEAQLAKFKARIEKSGVVYMSRIPPRMKPHKLKSLLEPYKIKIGRVYFAAEDVMTRQKRKQNGGSTQKLFTEGWIEFLDKNKAKALVKLLNNTKMDRRKHSYHHEDLWNLKYLPKFKWSHLTDRIAYEKEARAQRLRTEVAQAKRFNQQYIAKVEQNKQINAMEAKKAIKEQNKPLAQPKVLRHFHQRKVQTGELDPTEPYHPSKKSKTNTKGDKSMKWGKHSDKEAAMESVLSKIFE